MMKQVFHRTTSRERGTAYVLVLCIATLVTIAGIAALTVARVQLRSSAMSSDAEVARLNAQTAIELAKLWCYNDTDWRTNRKDGNWADSIAINGGSFSVSVTDPIDGDFRTGPLDPLVVTATGYQGRARQQIRVTLNPAPIAYTSLQPSLVSSGSFLVNSGRLTTNGLAATNNSMTLPAGAELEANAEAVGTFSGSGYLGNRTAGATPRTFPDPASVFDYYVANGTPINYGSCGGDLNGTLLSPADNPFGPTNANGIYIIDCGGKPIRVRGCRIVGTLVLLNTSTDSLVSDQVNLAPAVANYPVLMVKGSFSISHGNASLTETLTNYNPPTTPYNGTANATKGDTYPSSVKGLVYIAGNATLNFSGAMSGAVVVDGGLRTDGTFTLSWDRTSLDQPPPGFYSSAPMKVVANTWAQGVQ